MPFLIHSLPGLVIGLTLVFFAIRYLNPLYQTVTLLLIGYVILYLPLAQSSIRTSMEQIPPSLEEVGRSLGKRPITNFFKITLPLLTPGIGSGLALVFLEVMKELTSTLLLRPVGIDTLSTKIWEFTNELEYGASAPYALLLIVFSGLPVYLLTMKSFTDWKRVKTVEHEITSQTTK
ncbi:ABC transporter permease [Staphylococcus pettenkoferi]|uniref:ABC transporter permease subunit n=1 Tax=Staphylococcus pettenkoferi TaxID=170573 RepID=A0ABT4BND6_9STAP|nr:ABC transporter permease subunit [Staphylococcus pettenkoferi]MCI2802839.1 ABC transporter permease subunit [Staphylococcus pettenkoferi]MCY1565337.1 ABC transporter permease subunit [Staphylococcus pettenkoferi]MCY1570585.1 ABC transporter permease subunit [Staphylococcus pettenkoferi]MCY1584201.1 ABC transporter permease subunit [Staphylococcus pettenkoferi]MCY1589628.1 ABC transporter permease subunit [Staphylococcus pettenkoferi]